MFILKSNLDDMIVVSKSRGALEEVVLSLYQENFFTWFNVLSQERPMKFVYDNYDEAQIRALKDSYEYSIEIAKELEF